MQNKLTPSRAATFMELVAEEMLSGHPEADASGWIVGLSDGDDPIGQGALATVWSTEALFYARKAGKYDDGRARVAFVKRPRHHQAVAELLKATEGQPFRLDTAAGPLFIQGCLWRFAGQAGGHFEGTAECPLDKTPAPAWGSEWRLSVLAPARAVA